MSETTKSATNTDPQLLTEGGPIMLRDFNPRAVPRFTGRKCRTCGGEVMDHWLRFADDPDLRGEYWCSKDGQVFSEGLVE